MQLHLVYTYCNLVVPFIYASHASVKKLICTDTYLRLPLKCVHKT